MAGNRVVQCVGPSYQLADRKSAVQRTVNLFPRNVEVGGEPSSLVLDSAPGMDPVFIFSAVRSIYATEDRIFIVAGAGFWEALTTNLDTWFERANLVTFEGFVSMRHNETQLEISDGANLYIFTLATNVFTHVSNPSWRGSTPWIEYLDGYFIFVAPDSNQFYLSAIDDGATFDALDFSSADASADKLVTLRVLKHELLLFGTQSTEVWVDSGGADFPFVRYNSVPIDIGIVGNRAAVRTTDSVFWVGRTERSIGQVYYLWGHQPIRVSDQAVEEALASSTDISQCYSWSYLVRGNEFVGFEAPGMKTAWVYDVSSKMWHERARLVAGEYAGYSLQHVVLFNSLHYGLFNEKVCQVSMSTYDYAGEPLARERTWPHLVSPAFEPLTFRSVELACTTGKGGNITLEVSNDGGFNWGAPLIRSLGVIGRWMQRVRWMFLGSARDRVFRIKCSDPVPLTIHSATVDAS